MTVKKILCASLISLFASTAMATTFQIVRGNIADSSNVDVEIRTASTDCTAAGEVHCTGTYRNLKGIDAANIERFSSFKTLVREEIVLLNIKIDGQALGSCTDLQSKIAGASQVAINQDSCVIG